MLKKFFMYLLVICQFLVPIGAGLLHLYTVYLFGVNYGFLEALLSCCLPLLSEIWCAVDYTIECGLINTYTLCIGIYLLIVILRIVAMYGIQVCEEAEEDNSLEQHEEYSTLNRNDTFIIVGFIIIIVLLCILIFQRNNIPLTANESLDLEYVCITPSGRRYHTVKCKTLQGQFKSIPLREAVSKGYTPCSVCIK